MKPIIIFIMTLLCAACLPQSNNAVSESQNTEKTKAVNSINLTLAHSWKKGFPIFATSVDKYAELVEKLSDGRIKIKVDSVEVHQNAFGIFKSVKLGEYDIGQSFSVYFAKEEPDAIFFTTIPFGMNVMEQYAWFYEGGGIELANQVFGRHGIQVMPAGNTGSQMGGWFRKEINTLEDFRGLKMRIPGFGGKVLQKLGAETTTIASSELNQSLRIGLLDALEWIGPSHDLDMGFHKVAPYYYSGWHEPASELMYFFNQEKMQSLPEWAQDILREAAKLTAYNMTIESRHTSAKNWETMLAQYPNIQVRSFPDNVVKAMRKAHKEVMNEEYQRSASAKKIIDSRNNYLRRARAYTSISEQAYLNLPKEENQ